MREVKTGNVHSSVNHLSKLFSLRTGWPKSADDLGAALLGFDRLEDVVKFDVSGVGRLLCSR